MHEVELDASGDDCARACADVGAVAWEAAQRFCERESVLTPRPLGRKTFKFRFANFELQKF